MKAAIALSVALAGCATIPPASTGPTAALGEVATVEGARIRPIEVVEDSRCPVNVQCVWAGRLTLRARMTGSGWSQVRDFQLGVPQAVDRYRITLTHADPPKAEPGPIDRRSYRFTFESETAGL